MQAVLAPPVVLHALAFATLLPGAPQAPTPPVASKPAIEIVVERKLPDGHAEPMLPTHVFASGETIRLRVVSQFDGYLYVMDQGTTGQFSTVFPSLAAGSDNRVRRGNSYLVPSTEDGWFQITGPAGFDVLYFLLSPQAIVSPTATSFVAPGPISSLKPRCNDAAFRARGECTDVSAGPVALPKDAPLPAPLAPIAGAASRDITVVKKKDGVTVTSDGPRTAPVLYTFRLAHN